MHSAARGFTAQNTASLPAHLLVRCLLFDVPFSVHMGEAKGSIEAPLDPKPVAQCSGRERPARARAQIQFGPQRVQWRAHDAALKEKRGHCNTRRVLHQVQAQTSCVASWRYHGDATVCSRCCWVLSSTWIHYSPRQALLIYTSELRALPSACTL